MPGRKLPRSTVLSLVFIVLAGSITAAVMTYLSMNHNLWATGITFFSCFVPGFLVSYWLQQRMGQPRTNVS